MGEASQPGPATLLSSGGRAESEARGSLPDQELLNYLEQDLSTGTRRRVRRWVRDSDSDDAALMQVDLHSGKEGRGQVGQESRVGPRRVTSTSQSVQDREPPSTVPVTTFPASSGTVRRLVLVQSHQREPISGSTTVPASSGVVRAFQNRFEALREPEQIVDEEQGQVLGEAGERHSDLISEVVVGEIDLI